LPEGAGGGEQIFAGPQGGRLRPRRRWALISTYKPQLKNGWKSTEADPMGPWRGFWDMSGFTWRVKAKVDFALNAVADVSGEKPADIG
jgi:hypothetical protein